MTIASPDSSTSQARLITWIVSAVALWYVLIRCALLFFSVTLDPAATVDVILDDAYYYLGVAYNIANHGKSSFDGITETNGYQPAWLLLIASLESLLRLEKKGLFIALQCLVLAATALPLAYCMKRWRDPFYLALAGGLVAGYACYPGVLLLGLETALFAPALVALAHAARDGVGASSARAAWLFALIVWIRLDAVSLLAGYAAVLMYSWIEIGGFWFACRRLLAFLLPSALSLGLYAIANWLLFDVPVPVSGVAKAIGAPAFSNWGIAIYYLFQAVPVFVAGAVVLVSDAVWGKFENARWAYTGVAILALSLLPHYLYYAMFSGWIIWPWYFYHYALMLVLLGSRLVSIALLPRVSRQAGGRRGLWAIASLVLLCGFAIPALLHGVLIRQFVANQRHAGTPSGSVNRRNIADALDFARSGKKATIAMGDRMAGLGYWAPSDVHVFALEGLVANRAYLDARRRDDAERWIKEVIRPDYLIVDRESVPLLRLGDRERYVVIEPIQGRVVFDHLLTFCFPPDAVVKQTRERDTQVAVLSAPAVRIMFDFRRAEPCSGAHAEAARAAIMSPQSLRRSAVAAEYSKYVGGDWVAAWERFDRSLHVGTRAR